MAPAFERLSRNNRTIWKCKNCGGEVEAKYKPRTHHCIVHTQDAQDIQPSPNHGDQPVYSPYLSYQAQYGYSHTPGFYTPNIPPLTRPAMRPSSTTTPIVTDGATGNSTPTGRNQFDFTPQVSQPQMQHPQVSQPQMQQSKQYMEWVQF